MELCAPPQRGTACSCRAACWREDPRSAALWRPWCARPPRCNGCRARATSPAPSRPWTSLPTATGRRRPRRAISTPDRCHGCGSGHEYYGRRPTCCSPCSPAGPCYRDPLGGCAPLPCPCGASAARGAQSGGCWCRPDMRQPMQPLHLHCPELWTCRLSTTWAGREDPFLAGNCRAAKGGAPARPYMIVGAQRPRAVGVAGLRAPPLADIRPAVCCLCPVHLQPQ